MSEVNDITDKQFIPFLKKLGVETYNKSFEWMLNDPEFSGVLRWIYENIDENNALTAREECRYAELERKCQLLSADELETAVSELQNEFEGICLPGDQEGLENMKIDIQMDKDRLDMLEKQEVVLEDMIQKNKDIKKELNVEITKLKAAELQCIEDEANLGNDCLKLANEVESITSDVMVIVGDKLDIISHCHEDNEIAKRFLAFGPIEQYNKSQALFRSHFNLYCTKRLNDTEIKIKEEEVLKTIVKAKNLEDRLLNAISTYIESTAELSGEGAKLVLVSNYVQPHPNNLMSYTMEVMSSTEMLLQEKSILEQQLQDAVKEFVSRRTLLVEEMADKAALQVRLQIQSDLKWLLATTQDALALDRLLYYALRRELASLEEVLQFASDFKNYVVQETDAVSARIQSMSEITDEMARTEAKNNNVILSSLCKILGVNDFKSLIPAYKDIRNYATTLREDIVDAIKEREKDVVKIKKSQEVLHRYIWDGCTRSPNCYSTEVSAMSHALAHEIDVVDAIIKNMSTQFATLIKNGDKQHMRKLWQWFLTDPTKFIAVINRVD